MERLTAADCEVLRNWRAAEPRYEYYNDEIELQLRWAEEYLSLRRPTRMDLYRNILAAARAINAAPHAQFAIRVCTYDVFRQRITRIPAELRARARGEHWFVATNPEPVLFDKPITVP